MLAWFVFELPASIAGYGLWDSDWVLLESVSIDWVLLESVSILSEPNL